MLVEFASFETPLDLALLLKNGQKTSQGDANHLDLHHKMPGKSKNEPRNGGLLGLMVIYGRIRKKLP